MKTTIERMAEAHFSSIDGAHRWGEIGPAAQATHVSAMKAAIEAWPNAILVETVDGRFFRQELADVRDSLLEQQTVAEARRDRPTSEGIDHDDLHFEPCLASSDE